MLNKPVHSTEITRAFDQLLVNGTAPVLVAISGGSDSTALLVGLSNYFKANGIDADIIAATVDHGLRAESALEAQRVGDLCSNLGVRHIITKWEGAEQSGGIQAAARAARYALLGQIAREHCAQFVVTGHSLDDQLETIAMRSLRGNGRGLAGIPDATLFDRSTWFVRPLLSTPRSDLRAFLLGLGIGWIDDPSNENTDFERVRVRQHAFSASEQSQILDVQAAAQSARGSAAIAGARFVLDNTKFNIDADAKQGNLQLNSVEESGFEPALQALMCRIGRRSHFMSPVSIEKILDFARSGKNGEKFTIHGCLLTIAARKLVVEAEGRAKSEGVCCFDYLLPDTDFVLAEALNNRLNRPKAPLAPIKVGTH